MALALVDYIRVCCMHSFIGRAHIHSLARTAYAFCQHRLTPAVAALHLLFTLVAWEVGAVANTTTNAVAGDLAATAAVAVAAAVPVVAIAFVPCCRSRRLLALGSVVTPNPWTGRDRLSAAPGV